MELFDAVIRRFKQYECVMFCILFILNVASCPLFISYTMHTKHYAGIMHASKKFDSSLAVKHVIGFLCSGFIVSRVF